MILSNKISVGILTPFKPPFKVKKRNWTKKLQEMELFMLAPPAH